MKLPKLPESDVDPKKAKTLWDTIITSTPVAMTVIATLLAGLSNSELTQSLVYRSQAAQHQSKAGDQWSFFQAKKLRSANAATAAEQLMIGSDISALSPDSFAAAAAQLTARIDAISASKLPADQSAKLKAGIAASATGVQEAIATLTAPLPPITEAPITDENLRKVYDAVKTDPMEEKSAAIYGTFTTAVLQDALRAADRNARSDDEALRPMTDAIKKIQTALDALAAQATAVRRATTQAAPLPTLGASDRQSPAEVRQLAGDFSVAKDRFEAARYDREARLNQQVAYLYEVGVRKASWQSDRHRTRSKYFFYGMLGAQAAVLIATFSLAVRERSWMWSVAAAIGVIAVSYAGYVYLFT